ncbi:MAG: Vi polysaccharide biosynthesis UDP-N-acetylglucosamine C-6 dehydrogenase TviB, partial [Gammaproteobacteria bacterium]|nr:Vi polysaccharide biosynthesis UDP-N-acetylglucosamine C-6 dehydrogenase TviB [Gammaproteobacteria bacterium]
LIFNKLGIDTMDVLEAAGTKWNFLPFRPGLVGGHCISVDPYYLTQKAESIGYHPDIILAGRRINDGMGGYVSGQVIRLMTQKRIHVVDSKILILGFAFKENCPDLRNTRVIDIVNELSKHNAQVDVYDPWVNHEEAIEEYDLKLINEPKKNTYDAIIITVAHDEFKQMNPEDVHAFGKSEHIIYDVKHILPKDQVNGRL